MREPCPQISFCSMQNGQRETENQNSVARFEQASAVGGKRPRISALTPPSKPIAYWPANIVPILFLN